MYVYMIIVAGIFHASYIGLARTIYIRCICGIFGREITKYTVIYGAYIQFWPTLLIHGVCIRLWPILATTHVTSRSLSLQSTFHNLLSSIG